MLKLSYLHLSAAALAFVMLVGLDARVPRSKGHSNTHLPRSERMPNRNRRLERCRSSYPRDASNWASAGQARRPSHNYF
jgi:hypothetical protein